MLILDRYEGIFAVIETGNGMINIPRSDLPPGVKEGDILKLMVDTEATKIRKKHIDNRFYRLFKA